MTRQQQTIVAVVAAVIVVGLAVWAIVAFTGEDREEVVIVGETEETAPPDQQAMPPEQPASEGAGPDQGQDGDSVNIRVEQKTGEPSRVTSEAKPESAQPSPSGQPAAPGAGPAAKSEQKKAADQQVKKTMDQIAGGKLNMPAMVEFSATWCPPCQRMKPIVQDMENRYKGKVKVVTVDVDQFPDLASKYKVKSIPVQLFFDKKGVQVSRHEGFYPKDQLNSKISQMVVQKPQ